MSFAPAGIFPSQPLQGAMAEPVSVRVVGVVDLAVAFDLALLTLWHVEVVGAWKSQRIQGVHGEESLEEIAHH